MGKEAKKPKGRNGTTKAKSLGTRAQRLMVGRRRRWSAWIETSCAP